MSQMLHTDGCEKISFNQFSKIFFTSFLSQFFFLTIPLQNLFKIFTLFTIFRLEMQQSGRVAFNGEVKFFKRDLSSYGQKYCHILYFHIKFNIFIFQKTFDFALFLSQLEDTMLSNAVSFIECSALFFATLRALFSILNPKVKDTSYYLLILLPISLLLPAMAQAKSVDENGVDVE